MSSPEEAARKERAKKIADKAQLRIIDAKIAKKQPLFPDEQQLLDRIRTEPEGYREHIRLIVEDAFTKSFSIEKQRSIPPGTVPKVVDRLVTTLNLAKKIYEYGEGKNYPGGMQYEDRRVIARLLNRRNQEEGREFLEGTYEADTAADIPKKDINNRKAIRSLAASFLVENLK